MKRADSEFLRVISSFYGVDIVKEYQSRPLIYINRQNIKEAMESGETKVTAQEWLVGLPEARLPFNDFVMLFEQPNDINNAVWCHVEHVGPRKFQFTFMVGSEDSLTNNPTPLIHSIAEVNINGDEPMYNVYGVAVFDPDEYKGPENDKLVNVQRQISEVKSNYDYCMNCVHTIMVQLFGFFRYLETADFFPVQVMALAKGGKPHKVSKKAKAEPWRRQDLPTIRYLNELPTTGVRRESKGGHHASPKPHQRKGYRRTLSHERYKNHEWFGVKDAIPVSGSWVGDKEAIVQGTEYRVLTKDDIMKKVNARLNFVKN